MKNASVQVGADADVGMGWKAGAAFSYTDGSSDMTAGSADHKACGLAAYGTWLGEGGHFVDLIAKVSRVETDYGIKGTSGRFENNAFSLSAEYGRHFELAGGAFVEPQVEVTWGRIMGDDFLNSEGVRIEQDDFDSLIGRMGVRAGFNWASSTPAPPCCMTSRERARRLPAWVQRAYACPTTSAAPGVNSASARTSA